MHRPAASSAKYVYGSRRYRYESHNNHHSDADHGLMPRAKKQLPMENRRKPRTWWDGNTYPPRFVVRAIPCGRTRHVTLPRPSPVHGQERRELHIKYAKAEEVHLTVTTSSGCRAITSVWKTSSNATCVIAGCNRPTRTHPRHPSLGLCSLPHD